MKTSKIQTLDNGEEKLTSSQEDFLASHFHKQGKEEEIMMTVISGRRCYEQYGKYSHLGLLVKMLMESPIWWNPLKRLKWDVQTISSMRVSYTERKRNSPSGEFVKTLNKLDIGSNLLLFRLVPWGRHTEETECGLLQLLKTPTGFDATERLTAKTNPTPGNTGSLAQEIMGGLVFLPTPNAAEATHYSKKLNVNSQMGKGLTARAINNLLPTPKVQEKGGNCSRDRKHRNLSDKIAEIYNPDGKVSQLNPLFVEEMMGFPLMWTTLPFLSRNGEKKASKAMETHGYHK